MVLTLEVSAKVMRNVQYWGRSHRHLPLEDLNLTVVNNKCAIVFVVGEFTFETAVGGIISEHVDLAVQEPKILI